MYADQITIHHDSGTIEQQIDFAHQYARCADENEDHLQKIILKQNDEIARLRAERPGFKYKPMGKLKATNAYFIRQYEHLLIAMAHKAEPGIKFSGVCDRCHLLTTNRVHAEHYIKLHDIGFSCDMIPLPSFDQE